MSIRFAARVRVIPRDRLVFTEAVKMGAVEAREAYTHLIVDAEVMVDNEELKKVASIPEVAQSLQQVKAPETPTYKPSDWRAKKPVIRDIQWQQKPVINHIATTYKNDIMQAVQDSLKTLPRDWQSELLNAAAYRLEPQALQLSPSPDKVWRSVYSQVVMDLGSAADESGFVGKLAKEFDAAEAAGQIQQAGEHAVFQSSLTGFESLMKHLDPYAGAKLSATKVHGWEVADEPGYDKEIRSAFYDHFSEVVNGKVAKVANDGKIYYKPAEQPAEAPETPEEVPEGVERIKYISEAIDPGLPGGVEPPLDPPTTYYGDEDEVCDLCAGKGCKDCEWTGVLPEISPRDIADIRDQERLDRYYGK